MTSGLRWWSTKRLIPYHLLYCYVSFNENLSLYYSACIGKCEMTASSFPRLMHSFHNFLSSSTHRSLLHRWCLTCFCAQVRVGGAVDIMVPQEKKEELLADLVWPSHCIFIKHMFSLREKIKKSAIFQICRKTERSSTAFTSIMSRN